LDQETQKYYDNYFDLFATEGWKEFVKEMREVHENYRIEQIKDETELNRIKGERATLFRVLRFEDAIRRHYDLLMEKQQ
jgi:hypothetical protein